jgi:hypothetical protein
MNKEAQQRIDELRKEKRGEIARNVMLIFTSTATLLMALVLWIVLSQWERETTVYVQEAQDTVKSACRAAEGEALSAEVQKNCQAAERNELPQQIQSAIDNPDPNDPEFQDPERQESEQQDQETQDQETQDPESQEPELPDTEMNDPDPDNPETQDEEIQDEEIQEGEIQDPEIQDPEEQGYPVCSAGYSQREFHWYGRDGVDNTGDEQDWLICIKD